MYFCNGMVMVVGQIFYYYCGIVRVVVFINDGFYVCVFIVVDVVCDGVVQGVVSYVVRQCFINGCMQMWVGSWIVVVQMCGGDQFVNDFCKDFIVFGILCCFVVFGVGLFIMICYKKFFKKCVFLGGVNYKFFNCLLVVL